MNTKAKHAPGRGRISRWCQSLRCVTKTIISRWRRIHETGTPASSPPRLNCWRRAIWRLALSTMTLPPLMLASSLHDNRSGRSKAGRCARKFEQAVHRKREKLAAIRCHFQPKVKHEHHRKANRHCLSDHRIADCGRPVVRKKPIKKPAIKKVATYHANCCAKNRRVNRAIRSSAQSLGAKWPHEKPINLLRVLKSNGVQDMLWCIRATIEPYADFRLHLCGMYADFAESVLPMFE